AGARHRACLGGGKCVSSFPRASTRRAAGRGGAPMIPIARPQMGEEEKELVWAVLSSGLLARGTKVRELEERFADYIGTPHAVATSSGTTALHLALLAAGVGPED